MATATRSMSANERSARRSVSSITGRMRSRCAREAISGTTPPKRRCRSSCEATTEARTSSRSVTTAAAVSSQVVSRVSRFIRLKHNLRQWTGEESGFARRKSRNSRLLANKSGSCDISAGVNQWIDSTSAGLGTGVASGGDFDQPPCQLDLPGGHALPKPPQRPDRDADLLAELAHQCLLFRFARLDAAAGKTVDQRRDDRSGTANHQHPAVADRDADDAAAAGIVGNARASRRAA